MHICSWPNKSYECLCPPPVPKAKNVNPVEIEGSITEDEYDLMHHCTIDHPCPVDGALPDFDDGVKALNLLAGRGEHRLLF